MEIHIGQGDLEISVGWQFLTGLTAEQVFTQIKSLYALDSSEENDYNVALCNNGEVIGAFSTSYANAYLIEQIYFEN